MPFLSPDRVVTVAIVLAIMLLFAFPFHEFAHALAAYRLGDSTARLFGRLTLNPLAHLDPTGAAILAISMLVGFGIGWAKPTPVNPHNLRYGRWGEAIVAAAGPLSNLILATAGAIPLRYIYATGMDVPFLTGVLELFVFINLLLMIFNFIPIPPLDGSKVLFAFLDPRTSFQVRPILEQYGTLILLLAIFPLFGGRSLISIVFTALLNPLFALLTGQPFVGA
jgi:Zn-dependent protease